MLSLVVGVLFIAAARWFARSSAVDASWATTSGEVVGRSALPRGFWVPVVRYVADDGVERELQGTVGARPAPEQGRRVTVAYDPRAPSRAKLTDDERAGRTTVLSVTALA